MRLICMRLRSIHAPSGWYANPTLIRTNIKKTFQSQKLAYANLARSYPVGTHADYYSTRSVHMQPFFSGRPMRAQ